jgi:hypothetical protein
MKSAIAHLNAIKAMKALTPVEEVEPPVGASSSKR